MTWDEAMKRKQELEDAMDILGKWLNDFLDSYIVDDESYEKVEEAHRKLKKEYDSFLLEILYDDCEY